jgi:hypothetical protein
MSTAGTPPSQPLLWMSAMKAVVLCVAACAAALPASGAPPSFCMAKDSWTCAGPGPWIEQLDHMDYFSREARDLSGPDNARCYQYPWLGSSPDLLLLSQSRVTVMLVDGPYAYVCQSVESGGIGIFGCSYALVSDIRDQLWRPVSRDDLIRASAQTTMRDVVKSSSCVPPPGAELSR